MKGLIGKADGAGRGYFIPGVRHVTAFVAVTSGAISLLRIHHDLMIGAGVIAAGLLSFFVINLARQRH